MTRYAIEKKQRFVLGVDEDAKYKAYIYVAYRADDGTTKAETIEYSAQRYDSLVADQKTISGRPGAVIFVRIFVSKKDVLGMDMKAFPVTCDLEEGDNFERVMTLADLHEQQKQAERRFIELSISRNAGNIKKTAEEVGCNRKTIYRMLDAHDMDIR